MELKLKLPLVFLGEFLGKMKITNIFKLIRNKEYEDYINMVEKMAKQDQERKDLPDMLKPIWKDRIKENKEYEIKKGYALGFEEAVAYINDQLPQNEHIGEVFREEVRMYPKIAIRELLANALIHQDFNITGAGPMVEIFASRVEISNPGLPLIDPLRFIDETPKSRNETLARIMRRMNLCEERGTGIDKVIFQIELFQLPAPNFRKTTHSTLALLFGPKILNEMDSEERTRAAYQHACLQHVLGKKMTNESLRKRLGIKRSSYPLASRIIREAIKKNLVKPQGDEVGAGKSAVYLPFWA